MGVREERRYRKKEEINEEKCEAKHSCVVREEGGVKVAPIPPRFQLDTSPKPYGILVLQAHDLAPLSLDTLTHT